MLRFLGAVLQDDLHRRLSKYQVTDGRRNDEREDLSRRDAEAATEQASVCRR